jgi:hypothetical protein
MHLLPLKPHEIGSKKFHYYKSIILEIGCPAENTWLHIDTCKLVICGRFVYFKGTNLI